MLRQTALIALALGVGACHSSSPTWARPGLSAAYPAHWPLVQRTLDSAINADAAPGAVIGVSLRGRHWHYGTGVLGIGDSTRPDSTTLYDLASLTKVIGMTSAVLLGVSEGKLAVDSPLVKYVPAFGTTPEKRTVTLRILLAHASGLPAGRPLYREAANRAEAIALADTTPLDTVVGTRFVYSDLGAILLSQAVETVYGTRIDSLLAQRIFGPLGLEDTRYLPPASLRPRIAPTEDDPWRQRMIRGEVHDENTARMDGVSGHAGLFSTSTDLLRFADWLLAATSTPESRCPASPATLPIPDSLVRQFIRKQDIPPGSSRALGWDTPSGRSSGGDLISRRSFGHTGFTGTSIWLDPDRCLAIVLLSNRVHPTRENARWGPVRGIMANRVMQALLADSLTH
ncbi:MAG TPA: serine hydrolase domain-containing protein [Gemmatimonadales bacterium]|nr:serine hydrolase domain-containing protein [Gemmatimonadales bacterium]